jgi:hypothetical protein
MSSTPYRFFRKGLLLLFVFKPSRSGGSLSPAKPALACDPYRECLQGMYWSCTQCVCNCPIDPWGDLTDPSNCGPCV